MHCTVEEIKQRISSSEFTRWQVYIEKEANEFHRQDYFLAQIATEVRRSYVKNPRAVKLKQMLLEFTEPRFKTKKKIVPTMEESKSFWFAAVGLSRKEE